MSKAEILKEAQPQSPLKSLIGSGQVNQVAPAGIWEKRGSGVTRTFISFTERSRQSTGSQSDRETEREQQSRNKNALLGSSISLWFLWDSSSTSKATLSLLILIFLLFPFRFFLRKVKKNMFEKEQPSFLSFSFFWHSLHLDFPEKQSGGFFSNDPHYPASPSSAATLLLISENLRSSCSVASSTRDLSATFVYMILVFSLFFFFQLLISTSFNFWSALTC